MQFTFTNELNEDTTLTLFETVKQAQNEFLQTNIGQAINEAVDGGLRILLPSLIEDEIINIKNSILTGDFQEGIQTVIDNTVEKGKEVLGVVTGNIENINQVGNLTKDKKLIKGVAEVLENVVDKAVKNESIKKNIGNIIKSGENIILNSAEKNVENFVEKQVKKVSEIKEAIDNWKKYFEKQNFNKMEAEYKTIKNGTKNIMALEEVIIQANEIENLHNLIKNNGNSFDLTEEQLELAKKLM